MKTTRPKTGPLWAGALLALAAHSALAAVAADEAKKLGTTLTQTGAERAGNADKSIPEYTGGLTTPPAGYEKGSGIRPDPYAADKPLYAITAQNMAQYEGKLTAGTKELLKKYPTMRVDVYPSHRSMAFPKYVLDNTVKNATAVKTTDDGLGLEGTFAGIPFPIPKTGNEVMWNHLLRYTGQSYYTQYDSINVDSSGKAVLATTGQIYMDYPYYDPKRSGASADNDIYFRTKIAYTAPARRAGEALLAQDYINPMKNGRRAWQYLPGQRRVKLAPDIAYDTPNPGAAGASTYDDAWVFNGAMDRYDFKLVGKQEMLIPYNTFKLVYAKDPYAVTTPNHLNPDYVRWEAHRVWVVEATLKADKRHIYAKRTFYVDEDSWIAVASDQYDAREQLYRAGFVYTNPSYEVPAPASMGQSFHDFTTGGYNMTGLMGAYSVGLKYTDPMSATAWSADALAGSGVR
ncbi:DUF1329 domain-containing protein [Variovorax sp. J22R115]|uniref:DUF1329 domain-containing protein n=1 Tax=Variovorax sp. J22R115 TaxID=3053509 RepID=UPI002576612C|nr:DUF1329 domain-containing protein [Variovorax sp. J22R115]MDM0050459.1 DUF1329 domain-containing protein [Variovorax sp. J22R115]